MNSKERRLTRIQKGVCTSCDQKAEKDRTMCRPCLDKHNVRLKQFRDARPHLCRVCSNPIIKNKKYCIDHANYFRQKAKEKRELYRSQGLCYCGRQPIPNYSRCEKCLKAHRKHGNKYYRKNQYGGNRQKALERDNHTCQICQATKPARITVHHIDGMGDNTNNPNHNLDNLITLCQRCHNAFSTFCQSDKNKQLAISIIEKYITRHSQPT